MKIYLKEKQDSNEAKINFDFYKTHFLNLLLNKFPSQKFPNIMPYLKSINLENNNNSDWVGIIRQATHTNLSDRFLNPPYLIESEKHWIIF